MINSTTEYFFAGLFGVCFLGALFSGDRKIRYGFLILFSSWIFYQGIFWTIGPKLKYFPITEYITSAQWEMALELVVNLFVITAFFYLSDNPTERKIFSKWPNAILMIEVMIFTSHLSLFILGWKWYNLIINYLIAIEILIVIGVAFARTWGRAKKLRQYFKSRGLFKLSSNPDE